MITLIFKNIKDFLFELSFEPVNPTDTRYVLLEWRDGQLAEVEGK